MTRWITFFGCWFALGCTAQDSSLPVRPEWGPVRTTTPVPATWVEMRGPRPPSPPPAAPNLPDEPASLPTLAAVGVNSTSGLRFETGVGIAPYDDGVARFDLLPLDRPGFSDALLRMSWTRPISPGMRFVTTAAATRLQNLTVFETLGDAELAWVTLGLQISF
jgi:hypothetical protein